MASIEQLPSGAWRVTYYHQGKRQRSPALPDVDQARRWEAIHAGDKARGLRYDPAAPRTLFRDYATRWTALRPTGPNHAQSRAKEKSLLDQHILPSFGHRELGAITRHDVQTWINGLELAASSVRSAYQVLSQVLRMAAADGYLPTGAPVGKGLITLPAMATKPGWTILDHDQLDHLLLVTLKQHPAQYPAVRLLADTGMRQAEAFGLRRTDYSPLHGWVDVVAPLKRVGPIYVEGTRTKTGRRRRITLPPETVDALDAQLAAHSWPLIFPNRLGTAKDINAWRGRQWSLIVKDAGMVGLKPHDLRHTHITHLLDAGVEPSVVAERAGHASTKVTLDVYGHVLPGRQREALQLLSRRRAR